MPDKQNFTGIWKSKPDSITKKSKWEIYFYTKKDAVYGEVTNSTGHANKTILDHLQMINNKLSFTFKSKLDNSLLEVKLLLDGDKMNLNLYGIEGDYGNKDLYRQD